MEIIIAVFIAFGAYQWGASSTETDDRVATNDVIHMVEASQTAQKIEYLKNDGYFIKDLTVRKVVPDGCSRPVLTTDLMSPSQDSVRTVKEVKASCEG